MFASLPSRLTRLRFLYFAATLLLAFGAKPVSAETKLALEDAIHLALEKNPLIKVQSFGRAISRADLLAAKGLFDPAFTFRRNYAEDGTPLSGNPIVSNLIKTDNASVALEGTTPWGLNYSLGGSTLNQRLPQTGYANSFSTFGGITITQPLLRGFGFGPNLLGVRIAKADRRIADWEFRQTVIDTVTRVVIAYSDVAYAQQSLRIAKRSRELSAGLLAENERRFKVGSMSENDVTLARARTATRDESILFAQQSVRNAINGLRQLMGETIFLIDPEPIVVQPAETASSPASNPEQDLKQAYEARPDYHAAKLGLIKFKATDSSARNQLLPRIDFVGSYGYNGLDRNLSTSRRMVQDLENRSYSAGLVVSVPLTFAEGRGHARSARLHLHQAEADLTRLEQDIAVSIASVAGEIETTQRRVEANRNGYTLAKQALDGELKKLRAGTSTTFFVLELQSELAGAENNLFKALADQRRAYANYEREIGGTLAVHHISLDEKE